MQDPATARFWRLLAAPDIDLSSMLNCGKSNEPQAATKITDWVKSLALGKLGSVAIYKLNGSISLF